jgi:hypothetical protein
MNIVKRFVLATHTKVALKANDTTILQNVMKKRNLSHKHIKVKKEKRKKEEKKYKLIMKNK